MEYKILINNINYRIKKLSELTISEYNEIFRIIEDNDFQKLLYMLTDIPSKYMDYIPLDAIKRIDWNTILSEKLNAKKLNTKYLGRTLLNLDKIQVSRYIELDYYLVNDMEDKMEYMMAYLIRENDEDIKNLVSEIKKKLKLVDIISPVNYFINWRKEKLKVYKSLFSIQEEVEEDDEEEVEEETNTETDYGWIGVVYESAGPELGTIHQVFDLMFIEFLNILSWRKQRTEKEIEDQKKNRLH